MAPFQGVDTGPIPVERIETQTRRPCLGLNTLTRQSRVERIFIIF